jgi:hypothetical protein
MESFVVVVDHWVSRGGKTDEHGEGRGAGGRVR